MHNDKYDPLKENFKTFSKLPEAERAFISRQLADNDAAAPQEAKPVAADLSMAIKHVRAAEKVLGRVIIGGNPSEVGLSFLVQTLGYAIDNLEKVAAAPQEQAPADKDAVIASLDLRVQAVFDALRGIGDATLEHQARMDGYQTGHNNEFFHYKNGFNKALKVACAVAFDALQSQPQQVTKGGV